jgi:hypothetical protein
MEDQFEQDCFLLKEMICHNRFAERKHIEECIQEAQKSQGGLEMVIRLMQERKYIDASKLALVRQIMNAEAQAPLNEEEERQLEMDAKLVEIKRLAQDGKTGEAMKLAEELKKDEKYAKLGQTLTVKAFLVEEQQKRLAQE